MRAKRRGQHYPDLADLRSELQRAAELMPANPMRTTQVLGKASRGTSKAPRSNQRLQVTFVAAGVALLLIALAFMGRRVGHSQPVSPARGPATVQAAFAAAFDGPLDPGRMLDAVSDGQALKPVLRQAAANFPGLFASGRVELTSVTLSSPTTAAVRYTLTYHGGHPLADQPGQAVLTGGRWLVTRATYCTVLQASGATCPG